MKSPEEIRNLLDEMGTHVQEFVRKTKEKQPSLSPMILIIWGSVLSGLIGFSEEVGILSQEETSLLKQGVGKVSVTEAYDEGIIEVLMGRG